MPLLSFKQLRSLLRTTGNRVAGPGQEAYSLEFRPIDKIAVLLTWARSY